MQKGFILGLTYPSYCCTHSLEEHKYNKRAIKNNKPVIKKTVPSLNASEQFYFLKNGLEGNKMTCKSVTAQTDKELRS